MAGYNEQITRANVPVPTQVVNEILQEAPAQSVALTQFKKARMSTKTQTQPVLSVLPEAYWVNGDTGLKQTSHAEWKNLTMTAEELAVLVPIPNALVDDTNIPLWEEIKPLLVEAVGKKVDLASIWGLEKPASWPTAMVPAAIAAGNVVAEGTGGDFGVDVAALAQKVAEDGFNVNAFAGQPGLQWQLVQMRSTDGVPIYGNPMQAGQPGTLYGFPFVNVDNGSWQAATAKLVEFDRSKFIVGVRQDMTFDLFDQMVINDDAGKVIFNSAQQDSKVMRLVFRVGFQVANPLTRVNGTEAARYPAGVLTPKAGV